MTDFGNRLTGGLQPPPGLTHWTTQRLGPILPSSNSRSTRANLMFMRFFTELREAKVPVTLM